MYFLCPLETVNTSTSDVYKSTWTWCVCRRTLTRTRTRTRTRRDELPSLHAAVQCISWSKQRVCNIASLSFYRILLLASFFSIPLVFRCTTRHSGNSERRPRRRPRVQKFEQVQKFFISRKSESTRAVGVCECAASWSLDCRPLLFSLFTLPSGRDVRCSLWMCSYWAPRVEDYSTTQHLLLCRRYNSRFFSFFPFALQLFLSFSTLTVVFSCYLLFSSLFSSLCASRVSLTPTT